MTTPDFITDGKAIGLWFNAPPMKHQARLFVVHYTAGEGSGPDVYSVLHGRGLSVHFVIDPEGRVFQMADLHSHCAHASAVNDFAVGVEISNRGVPPASPKHPDRVEYEDIARGQTHKFLDFYDVQKQAFFELAEYVTNELAVPRMLPLELIGTQPLGRRVLRIAIPEEQIFGGPGVAQFKGVCGHCHVPSTAGKIDPGPAILDDLARHWGLI